MPPPYPGPGPDNIACLPSALTARRQWVLWRGVDRLHPSTGDITLTKIPIDPQTLTNADTTDPTTWGGLAMCLAALPVALEEWEQDQDNPGGYRGGGIGYVFAEDDPFVGIDCDHCVDPVTGAIVDWAQGVVTSLASYTEITPSQTGLHVIVEGTLPPKGRKKGAVEMYSYGRFFTMTGWRLDETPETIEPREGPLAQLWCALFGPEVGQSVWTLDAQGNVTNFDRKPWVIERIENAPSGEPYAFFRETTSGWPLTRCELAVGVGGQPAPVFFDDATLIARACAAANHTKVQRLAHGDWQQDFPSQSEADLAFCCELAFWTQDPDQIDRLFRTTALLRPKWDEKRGSQTYGQRTIAEALAWQQEHYWSNRPGANLAPIVPGTQAMGTPSGASGASSWGTPVQSVSFDFSAGVSDRTLMGRPYSPQRFLVDKMVPDGLTMLGAPAKSFKSYFALSLAMATVGAGNWCDAFPVESTGDVIFFALEGNERQLQNRLRQLCPDYDPHKNLYEIIFFFGMKALPSLRHGALQQVIEQVIVHYRPRLIVIDPLSYLYRLGRQDDLASATLDLLWPIADIVAEAGVALLAPEHMRKGSKEDVSFFDQVAGSWVKQAIVHAMLTLKREDEDIVMKTMLRDAGQQELVLSLTFDETQHRALWGFKGTYATRGASRMDTLKRKTLDELRSRRYPMNVAELIASLNLPSTEQTKSNLRQILHRAERDGDVAILKRGEYHWIGQ